MSQNTEMKKISRKLRCLNKKLISQMTLNMNNDLVSTVTTINFYGLLKLKLVVPWGYTVFQFFIGIYYKDV